MKRIDPTNLICTCCREEFKPNVEGMTPEESGYVLINNKPYCPDCWDIDNNGYVIDGIPVIEENHLLDAYCEDIKVEYKTYPNGDKRVKKIEAIIKGIHIRIKLIWWHIDKCRLYINNTDIDFVDGYMNLVSVIENDILVSADKNGYDLSAEEFVDFRNSLVEPIWQCMRVVADGRFAGSYRKVVGESIKKD